MKTAKILKLLFIGFILIPVIIGASYITMWVSVNYGLIYGLFTLISITSIIVAGLVGDF